jgi:uncharacterized protein (DUF3820 family)
MAKMNWDNVRRYRDAEHRDDTRMARIQWKKHKYDAVADEVMPYGKYKGYSVRAVPQDYLDWAVQNINPDLPLSKMLDKEWLRRYNKKNK